MMLYDRFTASNHNKGILFPNQRNFILVVLAWGGAFSSGMSIYC